MTDDSDAKRETAASFGAAADQYRSSDGHRSGADLDRLAEWCADATIALDVATGAGHTAGALVDAGVSTVLATDASPTMVRTAVDEFPGVEGAVADAERLPFGANAFDAIACRIAAHHFPNPEAFVAEVARVSRPGATFAFEDTVAPVRSGDDAARPGPDCGDPELGADSSAPDLDRTDLAEFIDRIERLRDPTHVRSHPTAQWTAWLRDHGFEIETVEHFTKRLPFDDWTAAQSLAPERRVRVERLLLEAPSEAKSVFEIEIEDGAVRSFANHKALIRATRSA